MRPTQFYGPIHQAFSLLVWERPGAGPVAGVVAIVAAVACAFATVVASAADVSVLAVAVSAD